MSSKLRTGELTRMMNMITKADIDICDADIQFLQFCREMGWGKLAGVLVKDGSPVMADTVRYDVRFDIQKSDLT